ncbi:MAG: hypothetical protein GY679_01885 [Mycoplasma sp.]|nr:hypothetical protein [Mycoplasma sp.]
MDIFMVVFSCIAISGMIASIAVLIKEVPGILCRMEPNFPELKGLGENQKLSASTWKIATLHEDMYNTDAYEAELAFGKGRNGNDW